jgi:hypothetical protein
MPKFKDSGVKPQKGQFTLELTRSALGKDKPSILSPSQQPLPVNVYYPDSVLHGFQEIVAETELCGLAFYNPFTEEFEQFPNKPSDFTARHLQLLARNESSNVSGIMDTRLYGDLLTDDQIARIRCLVKGTVVIGKVTATHAFGYGPKKAQALDNPEDVIVLDQAGLQWQGDLRNTGGMFFYPLPTEAAKLPREYVAWQNDMSKQMYGIVRPDKPSEKTLDLQWAPDLDSDVTIKGVLDLTAVSVGVMNEFQQAILGLADYSKTLPADAKPINFKFLKAGMGFFSEGLHDLEINYSFTGLQNEGLAKLELARLHGISLALQRLSIADLGTIKRLSLPFSDQIPYAAAKFRKEYADALGSIQDECTRLKLEWGGASVEDALLPVDGYLNAITNCADPHALIGNEGRYSSVDAAIASNIPDIQILNAAYNSNINCCSLTPQPDSPEETEDLMNMRDRNRYYRTSIQNSEGRERKENKAEELDDPDSNTPGMG